MKHFYIASSLKNKENVKLVSERLKQEGFIHTYDWAQNGQITSIEQLRDIGLKEMNAVKESNFIVVLLPAVASRSLCKHIGTSLRTSESLTSLNIQLFRECGRE